MRKLLTVALGLIVAACGAAEEGADTTPSTTIADGMTSTTIQMSSTTEVSVPAEARIAAAIADLARHLQIEPESIELVDVRGVQWPDGSLGCPREGELYTQAIVDGSQVILQVDGRMYDYRTDDEENVKLCPSEDKDGGYDFVPPPGLDEK
jgi:hypothetical protein